MSRIRVLLRLARAALAIAAQIVLLAPLGSAQFEELWTRRFGDSGTKSFFVLDSGLASDGSLRVLAIVQRDDPLDPTSLDGTDCLLLLSIDSRGSVEWAQSLHGEPNWSELAGGLRVAGDGSSYVASRSNGVRSLARYSPHGDVIWRRELDLNFFQYQKIVMALDVDGRVTVAGTPEVMLHDETDLAVVQFDAEGQERWRATYVGPGQGADLPWHMTFDGLGQVHLTGTTAYSPVRPGNAIVSIAFDRGGRTLWSTTFGTAPSDWVWPYVAHIAADGTSTIAGASQWPMQGLYPQSASFLLRIDGAGKILWAHVDPMSHGMSKQPAGIAVAPWGDVFVSGSRLDHSTTPPGLFSSSLVEAYSSAGERLWVEDMPNACKNSAFVGSPLIDSQGRLILLGSLGGGTECYPADMELVLLSPMGTRLAVQRIDISGGKYAWWATAHQDELGDLRIVGSSSQLFPSDGQLLFASRFAIE